MVIYGAKYFVFQDTFFGFIYKICVSRQQIFKICKHCDNINRNDVAHKWDIQDAIPQGILQDAIVAI